MTVAELVEKLQAFEADLEVKTITGHNDDLEDIGEPILYEERDGFHGFSKTVVRL